jgi:hypothetical protein
MISAKGMFPYISFSQNLEWMLNWNKLDNKLIDEYIALKPIKLS